jgi:phage antirepressor YoqD-like protein
MELTTINNVPNNWYTTEQIAKGFDCTPDAIRMCKSRNLNNLTEYIHWKSGPVTTVTGSKISIVWSEIGIIKLAELMAKTQKAQDFIFEIRFQEELKKRNLPKNFAEALRLAADQQEKIEEQARKIEQDKPKVELAESIIGHRTNFSVKEFIDNFKIIVGKNKFLEILRNDGILMDYPNRNHPYQQYSKYFKIQRVIKNEESREKILITPEGYVYLSRKYQNLMEKIEVDYLIEQ